MPLPGGASDKFGNRYEGRWTVTCMIEVMDERADCICIEPPGEEGKGVEFWIAKGDSREYHQVKRQLSATGRWTLADLGKKEISSNFWQKLKIPTASCIFISSYAAFQLYELADRAKRAVSWQEFNQEFLNAGQSKASEKLKNFQQLCRDWNNCSDIEAYEALQRISVRTIDEETLLTIVESRLFALVDSEPETVADVLAQLALDKVHYELTAQNIWHHLENRGYRRRQWDKDSHILAAIADANRRYLSPLHDAALASKVIPRDEAQTVLQKLTSPDSKRGLLLVGEAGVGKSGVMLQVVEALHKQGLPTLAFRIDRLEPTLLPNDVGQQLGLPGSPANVLAAIAQKRDCVLIIDQLDAVSWASGRNPQFFDCVAEIIKQAQAHPRMRLLLACRKFDLDNDHRLRRLTGENGIAETVAIRRLPHSTVQKVVAELGLEAIRLNGKQLDLLSVPLHLSLLSEIAEAPNVDVLDFKTAKDLYDQFWNRKQVVSRERRGHSIQWTHVIDALCDYMSNRQILSAPQQIVDDYADDARAMASEHVLIWEGKRLSFFHEGFFDYAFARRFAARSLKLLPLLRSSEQHLFRRAQVRQILLHQREADFDCYLDNLKELLTSTDIRFHLKQVVFALLAALNDPTAEEWSALAPLISNQTNLLTQQVWRTLRSSIHWFQLLDSLGIIKQWLRDESEEPIDQTVTLLSIMQRQIPDRVAELVEPYVGASEAWRNRLNHLVQRAELGNGHRFFRLFLRLIDEGILAQTEGNIDYICDFWRQIYSLPQQHPEWACEAIGCYLNCCLNLSLAAGQPNPFDRKSGTLRHSQFDEQVLSESALNAPKAFIQHILPFMLRVMELTARREDNPPWHDPIWYYRPYGRGYDIHGALLSEMKMALSSLAANQPKDFANIAKQQLRSSNFETIQYLLIRAYAANGERFADEAIDYICEQPARLQTGYRGAGNGNVRAAPYWATRQMLEAITPHCYEEKLIKLQAMILDYYTDYEKIPDCRWFRGYPQLILLDAIPPHQRTEAATRRLQEWRRKFTDLKLLEPSGKIKPPESAQAYLVGPPIPEAAADKMTDEQWLRAIARYDYDDAGSRFQRSRELIGGADQLSSLLEREVKQEPARFASLIWRFPDKANPCYFDAVLRGIAEVGIDVETAVRVCQRCHQLSQRPCGRSICWLIEKLAELPYPLTALDMIICYALEDPDPKQELWRTETPNGQVYYGGDILSAGINSTRGSALDTIAKLIFADKNRASYFQLPLQQIVRDPSIAVRSCAAEALTSVLNYDRDVAVSLFQQLCATEDALLGTDSIEHFLYYALPTHFQKLVPILERMIMSELPEVVQVGARQACLTSLVMEEARWLAELCLSGTEVHRKAAAEIFVANLRTTRFREFCEQALVQLFHDSSPEVRSQAARCFFRFEGEQLADVISQIQAFVQSPAFTTDCHDLIYALEKTTAKLPDITYIVCEQFINAVGSSAGDIRTRSAADANTISQLLIRVYSQSKDQALRSRCLDLIDRLAQIEAYGLDEALALYER